MTLDDFVTLTEMNNGLTAPSRVRDLVAFMQNENDCHVKNVGDSTRQWYAVASAIAATANKDSLDLFIQLDGLKFLDMWLKDSQKFSNNTSDSSVEDSVTLLLRALEKLPVNYEKLVASGIWTTIKNLLVHNNSKVQDKARELYQSWKKKTDGEASLSNVEKIGPSSDHDVGRTEDTERGSEHSEGGAFVQVKGQESTSDNPVLAPSSDAEAAQSMAKGLEPPSGDERLLEHVNLHSSATSDIKTPVYNSTVSTTVDAFSPDVSRQDAPHAVSPSDIKHTAAVGNSVEKEVSLEESKASQKPVTSCYDAADALKSESKSSSQLFSSNVDRSSWEGGPLHDNSRATDFEGKSTMDDNGYVNQPRSSNVFSAKAAGDFKHHMMHRSSSSEKSLKNPMNIGRFLSGTDDVGKINHNLQMGDSDFTNNYNFSKNKMDRGSHQGGKNSDIELDYGIIDPLEVARQVAIEVEREVGDYKEQSGSSSDKVPRLNKRQPSPDTVNTKQPSASEGSVKDMENDPDSSGEEASPKREDSATSTKTQDADQTNVTPDVESSQVTEAAKAEAEKEVGNFDLNLEICSEDNDQPANQFLAPVSIVSASKAKAAPRQPAGPLKFEGNLGWKGSATTSAFRLASPRRMLESEKDPSAGGNSSSCKPRQLCLEFDLNVAESVDGESSVATNSRKYEHLELDLNHASEDAGPSEWRIGQQFFPQGNGHLSRSHSSSSSSKQPFLRNIDLNGQPSFLNDSSDRSYLTKLSQNHNVCGGVKSDDSVISIMGTRVQVNRKDFVSQTQPLLDGQTPELAFDLNLGRSRNFLGVGSVVPYTHSPLYGYNSFAPGSGPTMPFTPNIYGSGGPITYMVDSRGAPVIPQLVGSVSTLPTTFTQPPFVMNMSGSSSSNGAGPSRSNFDLNSGMMVESGSGEPVGFRQFLSMGHVRPMDEQQLRSNAQPPVSFVGGKRKEPDGWEQYPSRNYAPPWK